MLKKIYKKEMKKLHKELEFHITYSAYFSTSVEIFKTVKKISNLKKIQYPKKITRIIIEKEQYDR